MRGWAAASGFAYAFHDDAALNRAPGWYRDKLGPRLPIVMDLVQLILLREAVADGGFDRAVWFDADTLIFAPDSLALPDAPHAFGLEVWIDETLANGMNGKLRPRRNVHNAAIMTTSGDTAVPFLIDTVQSIVRRADPAHIAPQMVGPKLLTALNTISGFTLWPDCGAFSPPVLRDIAAGGGPALDLLKAESDPLPAAANLCQTLAGGVGDGVLERAIERLLSSGCGALTGRSNPLFLAWGSK